MFFLFFLFKWNYLIYLILYLWYLSILWCLYFWLSFCVVLCVCSTVSVSLFSLLYQGTPDFSLLVKDVQCYCKTLKSLPLGIVCMFKLHESTSAQLLEAYVSFGKFFKIDLGGCFFLLACFFAYLFHFFVHVIALMNARASANFHAKWSEFDLFFQLIIFSFIEWLDWLKYYNCCLHLYNLDYSRAL